MIDSQGYLVLTDFGLAKTLERDEVANSRCGTPAYMAPEMFDHIGYSFPCDWWALGCLCYEMIVGFTPFS